MSECVCVCVYIYMFMNGGMYKKYRENAVELLQRYRRDRRILLDFLLSGSLIKKVVMPPGAVTLDDVDLDQVSVDYVLNCAKKGCWPCSFFAPFLNCNVCSEFFSFLLIILKCRCNA